MELQFKELDGGIRLVKMVGRLDLPGVEQIQADFSRYCAGDRPRVLVDLAQMSFLASTGIRLLLNAAKAVAGRGGKIGFVNPSPGLRDVLDVIGILSVIPIYPDLASATAALSAG